jgi:hypothetical protein
MDLQAAHAAYWFSKDTIQVRIAAVFVSLSATLQPSRRGCGAIAHLAHRSPAGGRMRRADRFKGL